MKVTQWVLDNVSTLSDVCRSFGKEGLLVLAKCIENWTTQEYTNWLFWSAS
jgi:hypothetical protein